MASPITSTATSLEGQLYESAVQLQSLEAQQNPVLDNVNLTFDIEAGIVTITAALPITLSGSGDASTLTAGTYLP